MKKVTIDDLARMVTKGFDETKKELHETEGRLRQEIKAVDNRVSDVDERLSSIEFYCPVTVLSAWKTACGKLKLFSKLNN